MSDHFFKFEFQIEKYPTLSQTDEDLAFTAKVKILFEKSQNASELYQKKCSSPLVQGFRTFYTENSWKI